MTLEDGYDEYRAGVSRSKGGYTAAVQPWRWNKLEFVHFFFLYRLMRAWGRLGQPPPTAWCVLRGACLGGGRNAPACRAIISVTDLGVLLLLSVLHIFLLLCVLRTILSIVVVCLFMLLYKYHGSRCYLPTANCCLLHLVGLLGVLFRVQQQGAACARRQPEGTCCAHTPA